LRMERPSNLGNEGVGSLWRNRSLEVATVTTAKDSRPLIARQHTNRATAYTSPK